MSVGVAILAEEVLAILLRDGIQEHDSDAWSRRKCQNRERALVMKKIEMRAAAEWEVELQVRWSCVINPYIYPEALFEWTTNTAEAPVAF